MKESDSFRSRRVGNVLNSLAGDWDEFGNLLDSSWTDVTDSSGGSIFDNTSYGPVDFVNNASDAGDWDEYGNLRAGTSDSLPQTFPEPSSDFYTGVGDPNPQPLPDNVVIPKGIPEAKAAQIASAGMPVGTSRVMTTADGKTIKVASTDSLPSLPDLATWYKVGTQLYKATGQTNAQGGPIYQQQAATSGPSTTTLLMIAAAAFMFLS